MTPVCVASSASEPTHGVSWLTPRVQIVVTTCACAGLSALLFAVDPSRHAIYPPCLLYQSTGIYCAGCGATRAMHALLHGRMLEALHDNALFVSALPLIVYVAASHALAAWKSNAWPEVVIQGRRVAWGGATLFLVMLAFMIARNLPGAPFDWLRP